MMELLDLPDELPQLTPAQKLSMKLEDIIKYEKMRGGVSHNLQFRKPRGNKKFHRKPNRRIGYRRPFFSRKRRSQNWRLRGNGPNTPSGKLKAFIEKKMRTSPHSVWHRFGWNPTQLAARNKLIFAKNYVRPNIRFQRVFSQPDPNRMQKMMLSARIYRNNNGLGGALASRNPALNKENLAKLSEVLGCDITDVKEEDTETGTVRTTITTERPACGSIASMRASLSNAFGSHAFDAPNFAMNNGGVNYWSNNPTCVNPLNSQNNPTPMQNGYINEGVGFPGGGPLSNRFFGRTNSELQPFNFDRHKDTPPPLVDGAERLGPSFANANQVFGGNMVGQSLRQRFLNGDTFGTRSIDQRFGGTNFTGQDPTMSQEFSGSSSSTPMVVRNGALSQSFSLPFFGRNQAQGESMDMAE